MTLDEIRDSYPDALMVDGHDDAIVGVASQCGGMDVILYDEEKIIETLQEDMTYEEACEHFSFNISGAYLGPATPMFLTKLEQ